MFYQNNNDYMRDAFYYSAPQASTYQNNFVPMNNMQNMQNMQTPMYQNGVMPVTNMYPQVYRIINPVANRVIANSNYQYLTEDTLNNLVDTVYNIVEGDVSTLSSTPMQANSGDDTVTQGPARSNQTTSTTNNTAGNSRQTTVTETNRTSTTTVMSNNNRGENQLLRDLIKIIIIKELLSRQTRFANEMPNNNQMNNCNFSGFNSNNYVDPRMYGLI